MKSTRLILGALAVLAVGSLGYWVCAQDEFRSPPMVLPKDFPSTDPFDASKVRRGIVTEEVTPAGGTAPMPMFPDFPKKDGAPMPLPPMLPDLSTPMPETEPTKALIKDGSLKDVIVKPAGNDALPPVPKKDTFVFPQPALDAFGPPKKETLPPPLIDPPFPEPKKDVPPLPITDPKKDLIVTPIVPKDPLPTPTFPEPKKDLIVSPIVPIDPMPAFPEPKKDLIVSPLVPKDPPPTFPEPKKDVFTTPLFPEPKPDPFTPPILPEPKKDVIVPAPKKELFTPPPVPEVKKDLFVAPLPEEKKETAPPTLIMPTPKTETTVEQRMKSFVRIRPPGSEALVPLPTPGPNLSPIPIQPPTSGGLNLQTASVTVEKRGAVRLRMGETQTYELIARNVGPVPASQVRIEEELPSGVRLVSAEPLPVMEGSRAVWTLPSMNVQQEQIIRVTLKALSDTEIGHRVAVHVSASSQSSFSLRPRQIAEGLAMRITGPGQAIVGKPVTFEIRITNQTGQAIDGMTLHGLLPDGLSTPEGRDIQGQVDGLFMPGQTKIVRMPATAVKPGRHTIRVKVSTKTGIDVVDSTTVDVAAGAGGVMLQQAPTTQMLLGRNGDLRIDVINQSDRPLKNVVVANKLPEEVDFVLASDRGFFQSNSRTVQWLIDQLPQGVTQTFYVRVHGNKAGQHSNVVTMRADGLNEIESPGVIRLDGSAELTMRVSSKDNVLEMGRETVYEIQLQNPGTMSASNVRLQVQFAPGLTPRKSDANSRCVIDRHTVTFEPVEAIGPQAQVVLRVSALGQSLGDQRVRFSVVSDQVRTPIQRELSTIVVGN